MEPSVGLGVVAQQYPTVVRNKTNITCVNGLTATSPTEQVNMLCMDSKDGLGVVAKRYPTAVRNKTNITCVHGPITTSSAEQVKTLCTDSTLGLGVVASDIPLLSEIRLILHVFMVRLLHPQQNR